MNAIRIVLPAGALVAALALFVGAVVGGEAEQGPGNVPPAGTDFVRAIPVTGPAGKPGKGGSAPLVFYRESKPLDPVKPGPGGEIVGKCPKGSLAINGYYFRRGEYGGFGLDHQGSSPAGKRKWAFYWDNVATDDQDRPIEIDGVVLGLVCDKDG